MAKHLPHKECAGELSAQWQEGGAQETSTCLACGRLCILSGLLKAGLFVLAPPSHQGPWVLPALSTSPPALCHCLSSDAPPHRGSLGSILASQLRHVSQKD